MSDIKLDKINVRTDLTSENSKENLRELADSIEQNGLMQPIVLKGELDIDKPYDVVVGQRRFMAHQLLGLTTIKATFTGKITDLDALVLSLSENLLRQELNYADTAEAVTTLYEAYGKDEYRVKEKLGLSIKAIRGFIKVESQATDKIKDLLRRGYVNMADAKRAIDAAQGDAYKADQLIEVISKMTRYEKIRAVDFGRAKPKAKVEEIIEQSKAAKIEESLILNLPYDVAMALKDASSKLVKDSELIITDILVEWLKNNDFLTYEN